MMKKLSGIISIFMAAIVLWTQLPLQSYALCGRETPDDSPFEYVIVGSNEGDIVAYAKCRICGERFAYCGPGSDKEHDWIQKEVSNTTCTEAGYYVLECRICHATWRTETDPPYGHRFGAWTVTKNPTCTEDGQEVRECEECHEKETRGIPATKHAWGAWTVAKNPTCTEDGQEVRECSACHEKETRGIPATKHAWGAWTVAKNPTCTEDGQEVRECSACHEKETRGIPATRQHQWGSWQTVKAASTSESGLEERECAVCHEKEQRTVEATGIYVNPGEANFKVLVAKELMREEGLYDGTADETLDPAFSEALKNFQKETEEKEASGALTVGTMAGLVTRFTEHYGKTIPSDGLMAQFPSGLLALSDFDSSYECLNDGTHERSSNFTGIRFARGNEEWTCPLPSEYHVSLEPVHESCRVGNPEGKCACGWKHEYETCIADITAFTSFAKWVLLNLPDDGGDSLYTFQHFGYEDYLGDYLYWEEAPGAASYHIEISIFDEEMHDFIPLNTVDQKETILFLNGLPEGDYAAKLTAFDEDGNPVSHEEIGGFVKYGTQDMPAPENPNILMQTAVVWTYPSILKQPLFHVGLSAYTEGSETPLWKAEKETAGNYADFTLELAKHGGFPAGTVLIADVTAEDPEHLSDSSKSVESPAVPWMPLDYYLVRQSVNVRSGAGKEYARIGGLKAGEIVASFAFETGEDGAAYRIIPYGEDVGYVNAAFLDWFMPKDFTVNVDLGNETTISVQTLPSGRIDMSDLETKIRKKENGRIGYRLTGFTYNGSSILETDILTPGMTLGTSWEEDPAYVWVTLHDTGTYDGYQEKRVPVLLGGVFEEKPSARDFVWSTEPEGQGILVRETTRFTADMTDLYSSRFIEADVKLGAYAGTCPQAVRQLYEKTDEKSRVLGTLKPGDTVRILATEVLSSKEWWYRVYSYRLDAEGYILVYLLDSSETAKRTVHFDAAGGSCRVKSLAVTPRYNKREYEFQYTLDSFPVPVRDGYVFIGWSDTAGKIYDTKTLITEAEVYLKAVWENGVPYGRRIAVTTLDFDRDEEAPFYLEEPGYEKKPFHAGVEITLIGEEGDMYRCEYDGKILWIEKRFVMTRFRPLVVSDDLRSYGHLNDFWRDGAGGYTIAEIWNGGTVYIVGEKDRSYKVIFNSASPWVKMTSSRYEGREWGWLQHSYENRFRSGVIEYKNHHVQNILSFDPGYGSCNTELLEFSRTIPRDLPEAFCPGYRFLGWFTDPIGGQQIIGGTPANKNGSMTVYAHYEGIYDERLRAAVVEAPAYERRTGAVPYIESGYHVSPGTVLVITETDESGKMFRASYGGRFYWFSLSDFTWAELRTTTHVEYKTDRYVRHEPRAKGKTYYQIQAPETVVIIGETKGYYWIAYEKDPTGFAYVSKRHFY